MKSILFLKKKTFTSFFFFFKKFNFFLKKYIYTINHKRIALNYLYFSFWSALTGTFLASLIRFELAFPGSHLFKGDSISYLQVITIHALIMIFFVVVPIFFGFFGNFFIPYHVGSKDVAFPRINSFGFWILPSAFFLLFKLILIRPQLYKSYDSQNLSFTQPKSKAFSLKKDTIKDSFNFLDNFRQTGNFFSFNKSYFLDKKTPFFVKCSNSSYTMSGWTFITPFSSNTLYSGFGSQDVGAVAVILVGASSTLSLTNLLITRRVLSIPGIKNRKSILPFLSITLFLVMRMLSLITPVLAAAMIMLLLDRHWKTSFFDYSYGGDVVLFNHLFWFFGHPEVYVVILPAFGVINTIIPFYNSKLITSKNHLIWASYIMGYMGFLVWGHHMYLVGLDHKTRSLYSTITIMISLPAVIKIVNWTLTLVNGTLYLDIPLLFAISFFFFFVSGGMTGMWLSHVSLNLYVHDTFYVVAHFHFLFSAATFSAIFSAVFHYFNIIFNYKYNKILAYYFLFFWNIGQWLTFIPLFWVGYNGLPRRYHDYNEIYATWHSLSSTGHIFSLVSVFLFFSVILESQINKNSPSFFNIIKLKPHKRLIYYVLKVKNKKSLFFINMLNILNFLPKKTTILLTFFYFIYFNFSVNEGLIHLDYFILNLFALMVVCFFLIFFINRFFINRKKTGLLLYSLFLPTLFFLSFSNSFLIYFLNYEILLVLSAAIFKFSSQNKRAVVVLFYFIFWTQLGSFFIFICFSYIYYITGNHLFFFLKNFNFHKDQVLIIKLLIFLGFGIKLPVWPFSFWLSKTHVEATTGFSIFLSGVLVKTALIGFLKLNFFYLKSQNDFVILIFIISFVGSSFKLFTQTDFKKLIAYTTIQEMSLSILFLVFNGLNNYNLLKFFIILHTLTTVQFFLLNDIVFTRFLNRQCSFFFGLSYSLPKLSFFFLSLFFVFIGIPFSLKFFVEFFFLLKTTSTSYLLILSLVIFLQYLSVVFFSKSTLPFFFGKKNFVVFDLSRSDFLILNFNFFMVYFFFITTSNYLVFTTIFLFFY